MMIAYMSGHLLAKTKYAMRVKLSIDLPPMRTADYRRRKYRSLPKPKQTGGWWRLCGAGSVGITTQPDARMGVDGVRTWIGAFLMNIIVHAEKGGRRNDTYWEIKTNCC
jgi:hypothetical protein